MVLGAQNIYWEAKGAFTGEISPAMIAGWCRYALVGHSERRRLFGETDESVNRRARAALEHGLRPMVAVGETLEEYELGHTEAVLGRQVPAAVEGIDEPQGLELVVAYEPVWAIGTGEAATAADAQEASSRIRAVLAELDPTGAEEVPILYGGSVTADNAAGFFAQPDVDGALVGGASLQAAGFAAIVAAAARVSTR